MSKPEVPFITLLYTTITRAYYAVYCMAVVTVKRTFNL